MFDIDPMSRTPIYEQIISQLERFIVSDSISPGDPIPSVRALSLELAVNPNTILKAYSELDRRGIIRAIPGRGYFVCDKAKEALLARERERLSSLEDEIYEMALAGISREEIIASIERAYAKQESNAKITANPQGGGKK